MTRTMTVDELRRDMDKILIEVEQACNNPVKLSKKQRKFKKVKKVVGPSKRFW